MERLAGLLAPGVTWPGYNNTAAGREMMVRGYSMEKPVLDITISNVGWWTDETMIRRAVNEWGEVREVFEMKLTNFPTIKSDS